MVAEVYVVCRQRCPMTVSHAKKSACRSGTDNFELGGSEEVSDCRRSIKYLKLSKQGANTRKRALCNETFGLSEYIKSTRSLNGKLWSI